MLWLGFVCTIHSIYSRNRTETVSRLFWGRKSARFAFNQNFFDMRWNMDSFSFLLFDCLILYTIKIACLCLCFVGRCRRFWFLLFAWEWIRLFLFFLLFRCCNDGRLRHWYTFTFLDCNQFLFVGRTKCERLIHFELNSLSTQLRWLFQHRCLFVKIHNRLTWLLAKIFLQSTILTGDYISIVFYLKNKTRLD